MSQAGTLANQTPGSDRKLLTGESGVGLREVSDTCGWIKRDMKGGRGGGVRERQEEREMEKEKPTGMWF